MRGSSRGHLGNAGTVIGSARIIFIAVFLGITALYGDESLAIAPCLFGLACMNRVPNIALTRA